MYDTDVYFITKIILLIYLYNNIFKEAAEIQIDKILLYLF